MSARSLVVVRAGDTSLHPEWLTGRSREWDLAVSYFGEGKTRNFHDAAFVHRFKGGKWDGLHAFFAAYPDAVTKYDYFWLPDDDISADTETINKLFQAMASYDLELAQPALTLESYFQHPITLENPLFRLRYSTMIEIMAPVLDRRLLISLLPLFATTRSGFGLDYIWHRLTTAPSRKAAILDELRVVHTRPIGSDLARTLKSINVDAEAERENLTARFDVTNYYGVVMAGQLRGGRTISSRSACALIQFLGLAAVFYRSRWQGDRLRSVAWKYYKLVRYCTAQIRYKPDISTLPDKDHRHKSLAIRQSLETQTASLRESPSSVFRQ